MSGVKTSCGGTENPLFPEKNLSVTKRPILCKQNYRVFFAKDGLISESFSFCLNSPKKGSNHYPEHLLFRTDFAQESDSAPFF